MDNSGLSIKMELVSTETDVFWPEQVATSGGLQAPTLKPCQLLLIVDNDQFTPSISVSVNNLVTRCKLNMAEIAVVAVPPGQIHAWHSLRDHYMPKYVFLLGVHPALLGIAALFQLNAVNLFGGSIWIVGPSLSAMDQNPSLKLELWNNAFSKAFTQ